MVPSREPATCKSQVRCHTNSATASLGHTRHATLFLWPWPWSDENDKHDLDMKFLGQHIQLEPQQTDKEHRHTWPKHRHAYFTISHIIHMHNHYAYSWQRQSRFTISLKLAFFLQKSQDLCAKCVIMTSRIHINFKTILWFLFTRIFWVPITRFTTDCSNSVHWDANQLVSGSQHYKWHKSQNN